MTVREELLTASTNWNDDEIDLRQYIHVLLRWWRELVVGPLIFIFLAVLVIFTMRLVLSPRYVATATVAIVRTTSDVTFDERFRTSAEQLGENTTSIGARRSALLGFVETGAIAQIVIDELGNRLNEVQQIPANLVNIVQADFVTGGATRADSDLIQISVTTDNPELSATIANAWATAYVTEVNKVYGQVPDQLLASIQDELTSAEITYQEAQNQLESFIGNNSIDELFSLVKALQRSLDQEVSLLEAYWLQWQQTQEQLNAAYSLRTQLQQGGDSAASSAAAALQILKISAFGMTPSQLQLEIRELPEVTASTMVQDIESLIHSLEERKENLEILIADNSDELRVGNSDGEQLRLNLQELRETRAALEAEQARQRQLTQQRDLQWETYQTLSNKVAELNLTRAAASSEVRLGTNAVPPIRSLPRIEYTVGVLGAGIVGLIVTLIAIFLADYLGLAPRLAKR